jgi:hypothetical protein
MPTRPAALIGYTSLPQAEPQRCLCELERRYRSAHGDLDVPLRSADWRRASSVRGSVRRDAWAPPTRGSARPRA